MYRLTNNLPTTDSFVVSHYNLQGTIHHLHPLFNHLDKLQFRKIKKQSLPLSATISRICNHKSSAIQAGDTRANTVLKSTKANVSQ